MKHPPSPAGFRSPRRDTIPAPPALPAVAPPAAAAPPGPSEGVRRAFVGDELHASRKKSAERGEKFAIYLPAEMVEEIRVTAIRERRSLTDAGREAWEAWLAARRARKAG